MQRGCKNIPSKIARAIKFAIGHASPSLINAKMQVRGTIYGHS